MRKCCLDLHSFAVFLQHIYLMKPKLVLQSFLKRRCLYSNLRNMNFVATLSKLLKSTLGFTGFDHMPNKVYISF